jgi:hypothetical protein
MHFVQQLLFKLEDIVITIVWLVQVTLIGLDLLLRKLGLQ